MLIASHGIKDQRIEIEESQVGEDEKTAEIEKGKGSVTTGCRYSHLYFRLEGSQEKMKLETRNLTNS